MKLLFVNTNIGYGGASKMMAWVASRMVERGHEVTFYTYRNNEVLQHLNPKIKHVHEQLEDKFGENKRLWSCVRGIRQQIKKEGYEVAIAFLYPSILRLAMAVVGTNCRVLFSERADPSQKPSSFKSNVTYNIMRFAFCSADAFVFQTPMAATFFPKFVQKKGMVIPNPVVPLVRTEDRSIGGDKRIVCVARLDINQKRQDLLIDAFNLIKCKYPEYSLCLYGDGLGNDEAILRERAKDNHQIKFMGSTKNVVNVIQNATMTVLSSDFEGIPNALLESMSIGVPSVSTDCSPGGAAMLIRNKVNGLLIPRGDVQALAGAMEYIITHPIEAEKMATLSMEVNEIYSEKVIADKWETIINKLGQQ